MYVVWEDHAAVVLVKGRSPIADRSENVWVFFCQSRIFSPPGNSLVAISDLARMIQNWVHSGPTERKAPTRATKDKYHPSWSWHLDHDICTISSWPSGIHQLHRWAHHHTSQRPVYTWYFRVRANHFTQQQICYILQSSLTEFPPASNLYMVRSHWGQPLHTTANLLHFIVKSHRVSSSVQLKHGTFALGPTTSENGTFATFYSQVSPSFL